MSESTAVLPAPMKKKTADAPAPLAAHAPSSSRPAGPQPCVGLPVQYHTGQDVVPGVLQRESTAEKGVWNVVIFRRGAFGLVTRHNVKFSETLKGGCWSFLPGWSFTG